MRSQKAGDDTEPIAEHNQPYLQQGKYTEEHDELSYYFLLYETLQFKAYPNINESDIHIIVEHLDFSTQIIHLVHTPTGHLLSKKYIEK